MDNALEELRQEQRKTLLRNKEIQIHQYITSRYNSSDTALMYDAYNAVLKTGLVEWFKHYIPEPDKGFILSNARQLAYIRSEMKLLHQHSGTSYAWTLRALQTMLNSI